VDRIFLNANVPFSAAYREDSPLLRLWGLPNVELMTSGYALEEAQRHLDAARRKRLASLKDDVHVVPEPPTRELPSRVQVRDKDAPIPSAAIAAGATHLITGDRRDFGAHFGERIGGVLVLPPRDSLALPPR
jgi:hypothetical protein